MSKYYVELEDVTQRLDNAIYEANRGAMGYDEALIRLRIVYAETMPTIEVSEGVIAQGSGDIDWQAVTSTGQEIYAKGYEDGRKSVEVSEDCISREYLEEEYWQTLIPREMINTDVELGINIGIDKMHDVIKNAPSVTTEQSSKVGEWIDRCREHEDYECSECGGVTEKFGGQYLYDYCPWCGARMKGAGDDISKTDIRSADD